VRGGISRAAAIEDCRKFCLAITLSARTGIELRRDCCGVRRFLSCGDPRVFIAASGVVALLRLGGAFGGGGARGGALRQRGRDRAKHGSGNQDEDGTRTSTVQHLSKPLVNPKVTRRITRAVRRKGAEGELTHPKLRKGTYATFRYRTGKSAI
jgi:hypothetical protein